MIHPEGCYYSAIDADSEGEEGKYYCWTLKEYQDVLSDNFAFASDLYSFNARGHWEEGKYIPLRTESDVSFTRKMNWSIEEFELNNERQLWMHSAPSGT